VSIINTSEYWLQSLYSEMQSMNLSKIADNPCDLSARVPMPPRDLEGTPGEAITSSFLFAEWRSIDVAVPVSDSAIYFNSLTREVVQEQEWKQECKYYCHNPLLHCAVNTSCGNCPDFSSIEVGDRPERQPPT
jgi:hypothetical protein